mmetsp:Transcript_4345/g.10486  ORF Transcript_4345/g.10486 Transcript_4345/m.10486 type:complete len:686 (-) Transcript_4345:196-2253(-)
MLSTYNKVEALRIVAFCLSLTAVASSLFEGGGDKQKLVVFAGPHRTSETNVEGFFYKFARGDKPAYYKEESLFGWSWPQILGLGSPHQAYNKLVEDFDKQDIRKKIIDTLLSHSEHASRGFIIGGDEFDRVGKTVWSHMDAEAAINKIAAATGISTNDITVILLYQSPRVEQWLSIFTHEITEAFDSSGNTGWKDYYEEYLCDPKTANKRLETLETAMNPFLLSSLYLDAGYNVVVIDLDGIEKAGLMVEHVIGCEILDGTCTNGLLDNLESESFKKYHDKDDKATHPFHSLTNNDVEHLEQLFRLRDCNYQNVMKHANFKLLHGKNMFSNCPENESETMKSLTDTSIFFNAIRTQKQCNANDISLENLLEEAPDIGVLDLSKYTDKEVLTTDVKISSLSSDSSGKTVLTNDESGTDIETAIAARDENSGNVVVGDTGQTDGIKSKASVKVESEALISPTNKESSGVGIGVATTENNMNDNKASTNMISASVGNEPLIYASNKNDNKNDFAASGAENTDNGSDGSPTESNHTSKNKVSTDDETDMVGSEGTTSTIHNSNNDMKISVSENIDDGKNEVSTNGEGDEVGDMASTSTNKEANNVVLGSNLVENSAAEDMTLHPSWIIQAILVMGMVIWMGFMIGFMSYSGREKRREKRGVAHYYTQGGIDGIIPTSGDEGNRPLSLIM